MLQVVEQFFAVGDFLLVVFDLLFLVFQGLVQFNLLKHIELVDEKNDDQKSDGNVNVTVVDFPEYIFKSHTMNFELFFAAKIMIKLKMGNVHFKQNPEDKRHFDKAACSEIFWKEKISEVSEASGLNVYLCPIKL